MAPHHHCVISGTGRAGTTFLVGLLTRLGIDTGFAPADVILENPAHAGLERTTLKRKLPYVVKSPWLCDRLEEALRRDADLVVDCVLLPVRDLKAAAESRLDVQERTTGSRNGSAVPGGLWLTSDAGAQESILQGQLATLIATVARHDIPLVLLWYPRLVQDPRYLFEKLKFLIPDISASEFERVFYDVVRPDWVHQFSPDDKA